MINITQQRRYKTKNRRRSKRIIFIRRLKTICSVDGDTKEVKPVVLAGKMSVQVETIPPKSSHKATVIIFHGAGIKCLHLINHAVNDQMHIFVLRR